MQIARDIRHDLPAGIVGGSAADRWEPAWKAYAASKREVNLGCAALSGSNPRPAHEWARQDKSKRQLVEPPLNGYNAFPVPLAALPPIVHRYAVTKEPGRPPRRHQRARDTL